MSPTAFFSFKFETISSIYTPNVYLEKRFRCACALVRDIYNISSLLLLFLFYFVLRLPNTRIAYAGVFPPKHTCPFIPCSRNGMQFFALGDTIIVLLIPERLDKEGSFFRSTIVYKSNIFLGEIFSERNYGKYIFYKEKETEEILLPRIIQLFQLFHRQKSRLFAASINSRTRTVLNTYSRGNMCVWKSGGKSMETPRPRCLCKIARAGGKTNITGFLLKQGCSYKKKKKERKREKKRKRKGRKREGKKAAPIVHRSFLSFLPRIDALRSMHQAFSFYFPRDRGGGLLTPSTNVHRSKYRRFLRPRRYFSPSTIIHHPPLSHSDFSYSSPFNRDHSSRPRNTSRPILLLVSSSPIIFLNQRSVESRRINGISTSTRLLCMCVCKNVSV